MPDEVKDVFIRTLRISELKIRQVLVMRGLIAYRRAKDHLMRIMNQVDVAAK
jgi:hypothetical protein